jgi:integrase/recombinase XerD
MRVSIYTRQKNQLGKWRYIRAGGRGRRSAAEVSGPFYMRHAGTAGRQVWTLAKADTLEDAKVEAETLARGLAAESSGLVVRGLDRITNANRVTIADAVKDFLTLKASKSPRTVSAYALNLREFQEAVGKRVHYLDDIEAATLRKFKEYMQQKGHAGKTQHNRLLTVIFLLKKNGIKNPLPWDEMPVVEVDPAIPFEPTELKKLFAAMTLEEVLRYKFFLGSGAREQEVSFASWKDLDLQKATFTIRQKPEVGFTPKTHETRTVPLPASLVELLKAEKKKADPVQRWIFKNADGNPEGHFLRKLKAVALRAGLNCGHCTSETADITNEQRGEAFSKKFGTGKEFFKNWNESQKPHKLTRTVTCRTHAVCSHWFLHRFRKTCASRWSEAGVPVRTIQHWLGHKDLTTTMRYLGTGDMHAPHVRAKIDQAFGD